MKRSPFRPGFRFRSLMALGCLSMPLLSCAGKSEPAPAGSTGALGIPCEVDKILTKNCQSCHGATVSNAAPMSLVTLADLQKKSKSDPSKTVLEMVKLRINDTARPMPAAGLLPEGDRKFISDWATSGGAGVATTAVCDKGTVTEPPKTGRDTLPCPRDTQTVFTAHGASPDEKYAVPVDAGNSYMCFGYKVPWGEKRQATAFTPIIDDARVLHHWILYETSTPQVEGSVAKCKMPPDATFIQGWAPGSAPKPFPADMGLELPGKEKWLILQVHYWNVARHENVKDASGVAMCTTTELRPKAVAVSRLGSAKIAVPPKTESWATEGNCTPELDAPVHIVSSSPHMHRAGTAFKTEILRADGKIETLVDIPKWDFESQTSYPADFVLNKGDRLRTTCTYQNPTEKTIYFGENTENEMCFNFVSSYPSTGIFNTAGKSIRGCIDR